MSSNHMKSFLIFVYILATVTQSYAFSAVNSIIRSPRLDMAVEIIVNDRNQNPIKVTEFLVYGDEIYAEQKDAVKLSEMPEVVSCLKNYGRCMVLVQLKADKSLGKSCVFPILDGKVLIKNSTEAKNYRVERAFFLAFILGEIEINWDKWPIYPSIGAVPANEH